MAAEQFMSVWQVCVKMSSDQSWGPLSQFIHRNRLLWNADHQSRRHLVSGFRHAEFCIKDVQLYNRMMSMNPGTSSIARCGEVGGLHDHTLTHVFFLIQMINAQFPTKRATSTWNIKIRLRSGEQNLDTCFVKRREAALQDERLFRQLHAIWSAIKKDHQGFLSKEVHEIIFARFFEIFAFDVSDVEMRAELVAKDWAIRADGRVAIDGERFMATMAATCDAWCETPCLDEMMEFSDHFLSLVIEVQERSAAMTSGEGRDVRQRGHRAVVANAVLLSLGKKNLSLEPLKRQKFEKKPGSLQLVVNGDDAEQSLDESFSKFGISESREEGADDIFGEEKLSVLELLERVDASRPKTGDMDKSTDDDDDVSFGGPVWDAENRRLSQPVVYRRRSRQKSAADRRGSAAFGPLAAALVIDGASSAGTVGAVPAPEHPASFATKSLVSFVIALAQGHVPHFSPRPVREPTVSTTIEPLGDEIPPEVLAAPGPAVSAAPAKHSSTGRRGADALVAPPMFARSGASRARRDLSKTASSVNEDEVSDDSVDEAVALAEASVGPASQGTTIFPSHTLEKIRSSVCTESPGSQQHHQLLSVPAAGEGGGGRRNRARSVVVSGPTFASGWSSFQDIVDSDPTSGEYKPSASLIGGGLEASMVGGGGGRRNNSTTSSSNFTPDHKTDDAVTLRRRSSVRRALSMSNKWDFVAAMKTVASDRSLSRQEETAVAALALREEEIFFSYHPLDALKCPVGLVRALSRVRGNMYTSSNDIYGDWFAPRCFGKISVNTLREKRRHLNRGLFEVDPVTRSLRILPLQWFADERVTRVGAATINDANGWLPLTVKASQFLSQQWFDGCDGVVELTQCAAFDESLLSGEMMNDPDMETSLPMSLSGTSNTLPQTTASRPPMQFVDMLTLRLSSNPPEVIAGRRTVLEGRRLCAKHDHLWEFGNKTNTYWAAFPHHIQERLRQWLQQVKEYDRAQFTRLTAATHVPGYTPAASLRRSIVSSLRSRSTQVARDPMYDLSFDDNIPEMSKFSAHTISLCFPAMSMTSWCGSMNRVVPIRYSTIFINEDHNVEAIRVTDDWIPTPVIRKRLYDSAKTGQPSPPQSAAVAAVTNPPRIVEPFQRTRIIPHEILEAAAAGYFSNEDTGGADSEEGDAPSAAFQLQLAGAIVPSAGGPIMLPLEAFANPDENKIAAAVAMPAQRQSFADNEMLDEQVGANSKLLLPASEEEATHKGTLDVQNLPPHSVRSLHASKAELALLREEVARPVLLEELKRRTRGVVDGEERSYLREQHQQPPRAQTNVRPGSSGFFRGKHLHTNHHARVGGGMATAPPKSKFSLANIGQEGLKAISENPVGETKVLVPSGGPLMSSSSSSPAPAAQRPESAAQRFLSRWHALHDALPAKPNRDKNCEQPQPMTPALNLSASSALGLTSSGVGDLSGPARSRPASSSAARPSHHASVQMQPYGHLRVRHLPANNTIV